MNNQNTPAVRLARGGVVAALYVALVWVSDMMGLAFGPLQFRLSEALCVLPFLFPEATVGVTLGCIVSNLLSPYGLLDMILGPVATLVGALLTARCRRWQLTAVPPVVANALIIGALIAFETAGEGLFLKAFAYHALTVGLGEAAVCCILGLPLLRALARTGRFGNGA